jgi:hypothetical protein
MNWVFISQETAFLMVIAVKTSNLNVIFYWSFVAWSWWTLSRYSSLAD